MRTACCDLRRVLWRHRPAATLVAVTALVRPEMKIEIEVTAKRRS
jgi:enamine deaminase RidA (YjgF/YER057c/UK114 family)